MDRASFVVSVIKEERRSRQGVVGGLGKEASIVRGKGDDVVEKEWLKPRELGAERCRTVLYLHTSASVSIRQHTSACVRELGAECWLCRPDADT